MHFWAMSISGLETGSLATIFSFFVRTAPLALALDEVLPVQVVREVSKAFLSYEKLEKQEQNCHKQEVIKTKDTFRIKYEFG